MHLRAISILFNVVEGYLLIKVGIVEGDLGIHLVCFNAFLIISKTMSDYMYRVAGDDPAGRGSLMTSENVS